MALLIVTLLVLGLAAVLLGLALCQIAGQSDDALAGVPDNPNATEVWILDRERAVLVQPAGLGVPEAAIVSSDGTIGGTLYDRRTVLNFETWHQAAAYAEGRARDLGWRVEYQDPFEPPGWDGDHDDEDLDA